MAGPIHKESKDLLAKEAEDCTDPTGDVDGYYWSCENCLEAPKSFMIAQCIHRTMGRLERRLRTTDQYMFNPELDVVRTAKNATVFCPDCPEGRQLLCSHCNGRIHNVNTVSALHSMEAIDPTASVSGGFIQLLLLLVDFVFLPIILAMALMKVGRSDKYLLGDDVCPVSDFVRHWLYRFDSGAATVVLSYLQTSCNMEDGYLRLIVDTWAHWSDDTTLLLCSACWRSFIFHMVVVRHAITPATVMARAVVYVVADWFLVTFGQVSESVASILPAGLTAPMFEYIGHLQAFVNYITQECQLWDYIESPFDRLPATVPRRRPAVGKLSELRYKYQRATRSLWRTYSEAQLRIMLLSILIPSVCATIRFLHISMGTGDAAEGGAFFGKTGDRVLIPMLGYMLSPAMVLVFVFVALLFVTVYYRSNMSKIRGAMKQSEVAVRADLDGDFEVVPCKVRWAPKTDMFLQPDVCDEEPKDAKGEESSSKKRLASKTSFNLPLPKRSRPGPDADFVVNGISCRSRHAPREPGLSSLSPPSIFVSPPPSIFAGDGGDTSRSPKAPQEIAAEQISADIRMEHPRLGKLLKEPASRSSSST